MTLFPALALAIVFLSACDSAEEPQDQDLYPEHVEIVQEAYITYDSLLTTREPEEARQLLVASLGDREGVQDPFLAEDDVSVCWQTPLGYTHCFVTETRSSVYREGEPGSNVVVEEPDPSSIVRAIAAAAVRGGQPRALVS